MSNTDTIVQISSLLSSRLCHDLVNPVGALNTGLEILDDDSDADMQEHALKLVRESTAKSIAILTLARLAYGSSGGFDGDLDMLEARTAVLEFYKHSKSEVDWNLTSSSLPKWKGRALLNILIAVERCVPRPGSLVKIEDTDTLKVIATGPKVKFSDEMAKAFSGQAEDIQPKDMPAYLAALLTETGNARIVNDYIMDDHIILSIVS